MKTKPKLTIKENNFINFHLLNGAKSVGKKDGKITAVYNNYKIKMSR